jgi:C4-dicarboxylate-specific signal transduction histidine kinase
MNGITATLDRIQAQTRYQSAREEGMLQVTTGIVHNIGNAAAVIELRLEELRREAMDEDEKLVALLADELLPILAEAESAGTFRDSAEGAGFLEGMDLLVSQFRRNLKRTGKALNGVASRLDGMQRILALQQRFAGELGTEERIQIHQPLQDALVIVRPALDEMEVAVIEGFDHTTPDVLVDRSMLMQVYVNLLQNAIDAVGRLDQPREVLVRTGVKVIHAEPWIYADVGDSGPGMPTGVFKALKNMRVSTETVTGMPLASDAQEDELFGRGLDYLRRVLRKYDGRLEVRRPADGGTRIRIMLRPVVE